MPNLKTSLLVVDDSAAICKTLSVLFGAVGYAVRVASNGFAALNAMREEVPEILLADLNMPEMSGYELLSVVRRRFPSVRVIAMSGAFTGMAVPAGVAADAFYEKGQRPILLLRIVEGIMRSRQAQVTHRSRPSAPIWIPTNGHNTSGEPYVIITCPECLRAFPQVLDQSSSKVLDAKCAYCSNPINYAIVPSPETMLSQY
jgi:CheY-like chemotaxis protein